MRIAIIGAGNVGGALGKNWAAKGHDICFGVRDPNAARHRDVLAATRGGRIATVAEAAAFGKVIALAVPFDGIAQVFAAAGDLSGKIVIDCANPLTADFRALTMGFTTYGGERVAALAPEASVFKALNQVSWDAMADPAFRGGRPVVFVAGNDASRKPTVVALIDDLGFEAVDAGDMGVSRLLEPLGMLWIHLANSQGLGRDFAFGLLRR